MAFNMLDYLLLFLLVMGSLWGLLAGAGRLLVGLFSLYVGLVISLLLYQPLAGFLRDLLPGMSITGSESLAFVFLLLTFVNGLSFVTRYFGTPPEERRKKKRGRVQEAVAKEGTRFLTGPLNQLGGLVVGFVVTIVWLSIMMAVFQFAVKAGWPTANSVRAAVEQQISTSALLWMSNYALYLIYRSVSIWVPGELPSIFRGLLSQFY